MRSHPRVHSHSHARPRIHDLRRTAGFQDPSGHVWAIAQ